MSSEEYEYHGTTDYSTEIFFMALREKKYQCYLTENTPLPLIHMDDALKATVQYLSADISVLKRRVYNLAGLSLTPKHFYTEIKKLVPEFTISYVPDHRQKIADSWPGSLNEESTKEWGWNFTMTAKELVPKMFAEVKEFEKARIAAGRKPIDQGHK